MNFFLKHQLIIHGISIIFLFSAFLLLVNFTFVQRPEPSIDEIVAKARTHQPAVKAGMKQLNIDPHDVYQIFETSGTLGNKPFVLQTVNLRNRDQYFFNSKTGEVSKAGPSDFIFPEPPRESF